MITTQQYKDLAAQLHIDTATLMACARVESSGIGFYKSGKIVIKFEGHVFHAFTKGRYDQSHPTISYPNWTEKYFQPGDKAYIRFDEAFALDPHAAMCSTSWGAFQIMGENYSSCGFKTVDDFVNALKQGDYQQLQAYAAYVRNQNLVRFLSAHDWKGYAYRYNGPMYQKNRYDKQLADAYAYYSKFNLS